MPGLKSVLNFEISDVLLVKHITGRLFHPAIGRSYHKYLNFPQVGMKYDVTGEDLIRRSAQNEDVTAFLAFHHQAAARLLQEYADPQRHRRRQAERHRAIRQPRNPSKNAFGAVINYLSKVVLAVLSAI